MTKGLININSCIWKGILYKHFRKSGHDEDKKNIYINYINQLKKLLRTVEKNYYAGKFNTVSSNLRKTWKLLNIVINKKLVNDIIGSFVVDGVSVETLHNYFVNIGKI